MSLSGQIIPLAGVALGAVTSYLAGSLNERARWRREQSVRWDARRLDAYAEYMHTVKELAARYRRLAAGRGLTTGPEPLEPTADVLAELAALEARRSALSETCALLGDTETNTAAKALDHSLWRLELLARDVPTEAAQNWEQASVQFRQAQQSYIERARTGLGVPGPARRDVTWPADWRPARREP
ncbi:hypothetical protein ABZ930_32185 [Streptomyces sp. NPDC046716]|uniref:hypothetical protein n=1 Tax=Streptomyces sp. NPDC046716 TaxID=3157093 RepID=UPI0033F85E83